MFEQKSIGESLLKEINEVYNEVKVQSMENRMEYINRITDAYLEAQGEVPPSNVLNRLSDLLLHDYVEGDTRSNKSQAEEYPILSEAQYLRRTRGQNQARQKHGITYVESPTDDFTKLNLEAEYIELGFLEDIEKDLD